MNEMDKIANENANGTMHTYSGASYQERLASNQTLILYGISLLVIFLCLAALYESWSVPFSVLLVVPLGVFGAVLSIYFRGLSNDVYFQVALLAVMGLASNQTLILYGISLLVIFLCLAALYESWSVPFSVLLVVPLGVFGAVLSIYFRDLSNDVYFQVALLAVMGLASKNAILIVEFINSAYKNGMHFMRVGVFLFLFYWLFLWEFLELF